MRDVAPENVPRKYRELSDEGRERAKVIRIVQKGKWEMPQHLLLCACVIRSGYLAFLVYFSFLCPTVILELTNY